MFEIVDSQVTGPVIKVIGVGGAGGNAVNHMIEQGVQGVEFIAVNTDAQVLSRNKAANQIQLGTSGLGAGAKPEEARAVAIADRDRIEETVAGAHMVFITAGMGGGTGTGAAPVIAEVARSLGILTVAVVTKPFTFEGSKRMKIAESGLEALAPHVDSLIVILNDKLEEVLGDDVTQEDAFRAADDVLNNVAAPKTGTANLPGPVDYGQLDAVPAVIRRNRASTVEALQQSGVDKYDIPAFLRKQAD